LPSVAVDVGHVRAADSVVRKPLIEGRHPHPAYFGLYFQPDWVVDHRTGDGCPLAERPAEVCRNVELPAGDMEVQLGSIFKRDYSRIQADHKSSE